MQWPKLSLFRNFQFSCCKYLEFSILHDGFSEIFTAFNYFAETPLLTATQKKLGSSPTPGGGSRGQRDKVQVASSEWWPGIKYF